MKLILNIVDCCNKYHSRPTSYKHSTSITSFPILKVEDISSLIESFIQKRRPCSHKTKETWIMLGIYTATRNCWNEKSCTICIISDMLIKTKKESIIWKWDWTDTQSDSTSYSQESAQTSQPSSTIKWELLIPLEPLVKKKSIKVIKRNVVYCGTISTASEGYALSMFMSFSKTMPCLSEAEVRLCFYKH